MGDRRDRAPAVLLNRERSLNVMVFLLSVIWSTSVGNSLPKDEEVLERLSFRLAFTHSRHHLLVQNPRVILK